jgi:hypothetical protein
MQHKDGVYKNKYLQKKQDKPKWTLMRLLNHMNVNVSPQYVLNNEVTRML